MKCICTEAKLGKMDLKQSIRHVGNAFLNSVETSSQEAAYMILQMSMTKMSRPVVFIHTSPPEGRIFLLRL